MNILFKNDKERELYQNFSKLRKIYGEKLGKLITRRIQELEAFDSVGQLLDSKVGKGHFLKAEYKNCIALRLTSNYRLIIEPVYGEDTDFAHLDIYGLKIVTILKVEDYHGN
ncbi:hypothetical protein [Bacillus sp. FJAT-27445]|uniref:hypothetical protein n=1 Tax=Bacillus sp. FJAT-27445 TaxID=1679166 RepID=UPI0007443261|nr:hypothetical protein [Bacillus sp. FJAT-27445]